MTHNKLIICPKSPDDAPTQIINIIQALTDIGLLADKFKNNAYYAGETFISLITFLGCSPNIQLKPHGGNPFCYITFSDIAPLSQHLGHCRSVTPKCPVCRHKLKDWQKVDGWQMASSEYNCDQCNTSSTLAELKWRQEGGYGRFSINITNIHPHEAVPAEKIFQTLENITGFEWSYFYANNQTELQE